MTLTDVLLHEAEVTYNITENLFRRVSTHELSWKPATGTHWMTVGQLMMHCANFSCGKAVQGFVTGNWGLPNDTGIDDVATEDHAPPATALPSVANTQEAFELLAIDREIAFNCIAEASESSLLSRTAIAPWGGPPFTIFQHLLHTIDHLTQHKGQLFYYLKLMGKDVNTNDLWGE